MNRQDEERLFTWERHGTSIFSAITVAIMLGIGSAVITMREDIAVIKVQIVSALDVKSAIDKLQENNRSMLTRIEILSSKYKSVEREIESNVKR